MRLVDNKPSQRALRGADIAQHHTNGGSGGVVFCVSHYMAATKFKFHVSNEAAGADAAFRRGPREHYCTTRQLDVRTRGDPSGSVR